MNKKRIILISLFFVLSFILIKYYEFDQIFTLENIKKNDAILQKNVNENYFLSVLIFMLLHIILSTVPIPGGDTVVALSGGYLFGAILGGIYSTIAISIGSTIAFIFFRYFIRHHKNFSPKKYIKMKDKIKKKETIYFVLLRIVPVLPTSIINFLGALSPIHLTTFIFASIVGIIPISFLYSYSGTRLHEIHSVTEIFIIPIFLGLFFLILTILMPKFFAKFKK